MPFLNYTMAKVYYIDETDALVQETLTKLCMKQLICQSEPVGFNQEILSALVPDIRRGDVICFAKDKDYRYRNENVLIYDGKHFQELNRDYDEYGHVPTSFEVTDRMFAPDYWAHAIWHNTYFYPCHAIRERALEAITYGPLSGFTHPTHSSTFTIGIKTYTLIYDHISFKFKENSEDAADHFRDKIISVPWEYGLESCNLEVNFDSIDTSRCLLIA